MTGETDLHTLLQSMSPSLLEGEYVFLSFQGARYAEHAELAPIASFQEPEGLTLVVPRSNAEQYAHTYEGVFRCITLRVHSSLEAVGLTAAFASQLTQHGISANVIAGFYHDHIFVSAHDATRAIAALQALSD